MLFSIQKIAANKKRPEMTKRREMTILTTKKMQLNFYLHGREKPATHEQQ